MEVGKLKEQLRAIAESEYRKIWEQHPVTLDYPGEYNITAFSILNTPKLGISYWHGPEGSGLSFCELVYDVSSYLDSKNIRYFRTMEDAEAFLKKTKARSFENPYTCRITRCYVHYGDFINAISDETFKSLEKDIQLEKTIINKKRSCSHLRNSM